MKVKKLLAGVLALTLLAVQPVQIACAVDEAAVDQGTEGVTAEEQEQAAIDQAAAEKQAAYDTPPDTNQLKGWAAGPQVYADSAIVMDMKSGAILYAKKADEKHFPASITKLLTVLVALENAELTDKVTFTQDSVDFLNWDDAHIGMTPGEELTLEDALHAVLLASANEVSYAVAESVGKTRLHGDYQTFIDLMNTRAKELGCTGSHWVNPNGLHDEEHYTTAHDMALIASAVYQQPEFRKIMETLEYRIPPTNLVNEERVFQQNHKMLWPENFYYSEYCKGGKTGYTDQSGTTLVTMEDNGTLQLAAVVLHDYGADAYTDTQAMFDYAFQNFTKVPVTQLKETEEVKEVKEFIPEEAYVVLPNGVNPQEVSSKLQMQNDKDGKVVYTYEGQVVGTATVEVKEDEVKVSATEKEQEKESDRKPGLGRIITIVVGGVVILGVVFFLIQYSRYKKRQERLRRMRKKKAAQARRMREERERARSMQDPYQDPRMNRRQNTRYDHNQDPRQNGGQNVQRRPRKR